MDEGLIHIIRPREEYEEEVNMVSGCPGEFIIFYVDYMNEDPVQLHAISSTWLVRWNIGMDLAEFAVETPEDVLS